MPVKNNSVGIQPYYHAEPPQQRYVIQQEHYFNTSPFAKVPPRETCLEQTSPD